MNRSLRAAGGALATAAVVITVLLVIALIDPRATTIHLEQADHDTAVAASRDGIKPLDHRLVKPWQRLDVQLGELEKRLDEHARRGDDAVAANRQQLVEAESRLRAELDRRPGDLRLLETIRTTLADRGDDQRLASIETRLKSLAGTIERESQETAILREAIGRLQPVLDVTADRDQPPHFTIRARRVPLADVLERLEALCDWKFDTTAAANSIVSIEPLEQVTLEEALEVLLPAAGCAARLEGFRVSVMSLAEARRLQEQEVSPPSTGRIDKAVPGRSPERAAGEVREVILEVVILSVQLNSEFPAGIGEKVQSTDSSEGPGHSTGGILDQPVPEFLERLGRMVVMQVLTRPRLRVVDGEIARLETSSHPSARVEITPRVVAEGAIELDVTLWKTSAVAGDAEELPARLTRVLLTQGGTVFLGRVFRDDVSRRSSGNVPSSRRPRLLERLLGDHVSQSSVPPVAAGRRELIVLVTPRLVDQRSGESPRQARR